jgi:folate-binding protein YgfZ
MTTLDLSAHFGFVRVRGSTRLDFLHRMSSGDLLKLKPGEGATTVFTTPIGRIVDYSTVLVFDDSILLLTGGGNPAKLIRWLQKYIFFNDNVQLSDESATQKMFGLLDEWMSRDQKMRGDEWLREAKTYSHKKLDDCIVVKPNAQSPLNAFVIQSSQSSSSEEYERLRIEAGIPRFPNEINEDIIPLEAGLWDAVSFNKGCYIGQEIIARMESRGQIAKRLAHLKILRGACEAGQTIHVGDEIAGKITSATHSYALGYVRSALAIVGQTFHTDNAELNLTRIVDTR